MSWFEKILPSVIKNPITQPSNVPKGLWKKCPECFVIHYEKELEKNFFVCSSCNHHMAINPVTRLKSFLDPESSTELFQNYESVDPLKFKDLKKYKDRLADAKKKTEQKESMVSMQGKLEDINVYVNAFNFAFMGGSMGSVVGAKFIQTAQLALQNRHPLICFATSGGARMQESLFSLFQMANTSGAVESLKKQKIPFISVLTNPTYGGVTASFAMLGDIIIAEPKAAIGFAGPRVIEQTVREKLPEGFQCSEFLLDHGFIDLIVNRKDLRSKIAELLRIFNFYQ